MRRLLAPVPPDRRPRRCAQLVAGLILYGSTAAMLVLAGLGLDPWDVLHQGLSRTPLAVTERNTACLRLPRTPAGHRNHRCPAMAGQRRRRMTTIEVAKKDPSESRTITAVATALNT
jgi:hypothetical protein